MYHHEAFFKTAVSSPPPSTAYGAAGDEVDAFHIMEVPLQDQPEVVPTEQIQQFF